MSHTDLQINICVTMKSLTVNLLQVFFYYYVWVFFYRCLPHVPMFLLCYISKHVSTAHYYLGGTQGHITFRHVWVHVTPPPLPARTELDLVLTGILHNNKITLVIFNDLLNTWYLLNLLQAYLLLTSQILYTLVKHMQEHINNEHSGKIFFLNYSKCMLINYD